MKKNYSLLFVCLAFAEFVYAQPEALDKKVKSKKSHQSKPKAKVLVSKKSDSQEKPFKKSSAKANHYIYPRSHRPKKNAQGVAVAGLSMKGSHLVPFSTDSKQDMHDGMMHLYDHACYGKHAHVLQVMNAVVEKQSKKDYTQFKKAVARIHAAGDDWGALKDAVSSYDAFVCKQVDLFQKQRLQKREPVRNMKLQKTVKKFAHTQPELLYASGVLVHSRLLLAEYAQDHRLDQYMQNVEKSLKSSAIQKKFNTSDKRLVQLRNRLVALCILLEGAVLHYCAVKEALVTEIEKKSLPDQKGIDALIREIKQTIAL